MKKGILMKRNRCNTDRSTHEVDKLVLEDI